MAKRITVAQAEIFKAHAEAFKTGKWDFPEKFYGDKAKLISLLKQGKTFKGVWDVIQDRFCSISAQLMACPEVLNWQSSAYKTAMIKGFKETLSGLGIE